MNLKKTQKIVMGLLATTLAIPAAISADAFNRSVLQAQGTPAHVVKEMPKELVAQVASSISNQTSFASLPVEHKAAVTSRFVADTTSKLSDVAAPYYELQRLERARKAEEARVLREALAAGQEPVAVEEAVAGEEAVVADENAPANIKTVERFDSQKNDIDATLVDPIPPAKNSGREIEESLVNEKLVGMGLDSEAIVEYAPAGLHLYDAGYFNHPKFNTYLKVTNQYLKDMGTKNAPKMTFKDYLVLSSLFDKPTDDLKAIKAELERKAGEKSKGNVTALDCYALKALRSAHIDENDDNIAEAKVLIGSLGITEPTEYDFRALQVIRGDKGFEKQKADLKIPNEITKANVKATAFILQNDIQDPNFEGIVDVQALGLEGTQQEIIDLTTLTHLKVQNLSKHHFDALKAVRILAVNNQGFKANLENLNIVAHYVSVLEASPRNLTQLQVFEFFNQADAKSAFTFAAKFLQDKAPKKATPEVIAFLEQMQPVVKGALEAKKLKDNAKDVAEFVVGAYYLKEVMQNPIQTNDAHLLTYVNNLYSIWNNIGINPSRFAVELANKLSAIKQPINLDNVRLAARIVALNGQGGKKQQAGILLDQSDFDAAIDFANDKGKHIESADDFAAAKKARAEKEAMIEFVRTVRGDKDAVPTQNDADDYRTLASQFPKLPDADAINTFKLIQEIRSGDLEAQIAKICPHTIVSEADITAATLDTVQKQAAKLSGLEAEDLLKSADERVERAIERAYEDARTSEDQVTAGLVNALQHIRAESKFVDIQESASLIVAVALFNQATGAMPNPAEMERANKAVQALYRFGHTLDVKKSQQAKNQSFSAAYDLIGFTSARELELNNPNLLSIFFTYYVELKDAANKNAVVDPLNPQNEDLDTIKFLAAHIAKTTVAGKLNPAAIIKVALQIRNGVDLDKIDTK
ncbi:MAG: hypothetical protein K2Y18_07775 [Alphaproteobacteria bacterium]|jgi:hypothetical protein|nr:hypothetical protein [Alphaproteobacteria bacterium]